MDEFNSDKPADPLPSTEEVKPKAEEAIKPEPCFCECGKEAMPDNIQCWDCVHRK